MAHTVEGLMNTSVDDVKTTLQYVTDLEVLRQTLARCDDLGHVSRARLVVRRIRQLEEAEQCN